MAQAAQIQDIYPLSHMQEGMLFHSLMDVSSKAYVEQTSFTITGNLCIDSFLKSLNLLVSRYDIFRTIFIKEVQDLTGPQQVVLSNRELTVYREDFSHLADHEQQALIDAFMTKDREKGFNLQKDPLMRLALFDRGNSQYTCVWTHHHIIMDGWCLGIILKEFFSMYDSLKNNSPVRLGSTVPYSRYIEWLGEQDQEETAAYWSEYLKEYGNTASIPRINPRPVDGDYKADQISFSLAPEMVEKLTEAAQNWGVTLNTLFMSMWGVLLHRYNATDDAVFGSVISGRPSAIDGIESMVGLFINTIPVRIRSAESMTFSSLAKAVQEDILASEQHGYYPLYEIQNHSLLKQGLIDHIFVFENYPVQLDQALSIESENEENALKLGDISMSEQTNYDFNIVIVPGESFYIKFSYNAAVYEREEMLRIQGHLKQALDCILAHPDIAVSDINIVPPEEQQVIQLFNETERPYVNKTISQLFEEQARKTPEAAALKMGDDCWTYRQLNIRANQIAHALIEKGVGSGDIVAVMMNRSMEMPAALLGIWKAGGAYMPLDPNFPEERLSFLLKDSQAAQLLIEENLMSFIPPHYKGNMITIEHTESHQTAAPDVPLGDLAYLIYTSGTTGRPKGVLVNHQGIANTLQWRREEYGMAEQDISLHLFSYVFDGCVTSLFTPLISGACVLLTTDDEAKYVLALKRKIARYKVSHMIIVPSLYRVLLEVMTADDAKSLRIVTFAGEAVTPDLLEMSEKICPSAELANEYGPTENSVATTILRQLNEKERITIGHPIANTKVFVLHGNQMQPIGAAGELCISGTGLARGYYKQPELTEKAFSDHPFLEGERLYRTGDAGRFLPDGTIEYIGRFDDQVKIRGYRIELKEIETVLRQAPGVKEAAVLARDVSAEEKELVAYIVPEKGNNLPDLHRHLAGTLPPYMIPASITNISRMPLTSSGKLDRSALPEPENNASLTYMPPRTLIEADLAHIWEDVLNKQQIGSRDDFFQLGGQSLKAALLVSRIHKKLNVELPISEVFSNPTVESMAVKLMSLKEHAFTQIEPADQRDVYPLSFSQKRLYALHQLADDSTGYNMPAELELRGNLDRQRLRSVLTELVNRHEALRTVFVLDRGEPVQIIHPEMAFDLKELEMESEQMLESAIESFIKPFDLSSGPLFRACVITMGNNRGFLLLDMHHIIADGVSMSTLVQEFTDLYCEKELPALNLHYKDFAVWQQEKYPKELYKKQEAYWLDQLGGSLPVLELPLDKTRPRLPDFSGGTIEVNIDKDTADELHRLMVETGTTLYMILLAVYSILLSKLSGQEDIVVGSPAAGRPHADLERVIGMFVNTLAMRSQPEGHKTFSSYLQDIRHLALTAYEHQDYPFEELADKLDTHREVNRNPLFDAMLVLQSSEDFQFEVPGLSISSVTPKHDISKFDLTLHAEEHSGGIHCRFEYSTALFEEETIARWASHFIELVKSVTADTKMRISEMQLLPAAERNLLLEKMGQYAAYPRNENIVSLFEKQAAEHPEHLAVVYGHSQLTYRDLNEKAERTAAMLIKQGVRTGDIVGLMLDRSPDMIIGILSILKAGGAYLPIDPEYPQERISFMLNDSGAEMLLTERGQNKPADYNGPILYINEVENDSIPADLKIQTLADQPAYVIYTSGTTGQPKGVIVEHRNVISLLKHQNLPFKFGHEDVWTLFHSYCFDFSVWEMFGALLNGSTLVVVSKETARDPHAFRLLLKKERVTVLNQTPTAFYGLMHEDQNHTDRLNIRYVIFGGEALQSCMLQSWNKKYPDTDLINMYGITETTVHVTFKKLSAADIAKNKSNIGRPLSTLQAYVMDAHMNLQPIGVPGEMYIGGEGVARGYLNRDELTADRFVPNPYLPGDRLYRTGDLAKRLSNGELEYLGRIDDQVKVRGHRIELGEIQAALLQLPIVKEAAVITRTDEQGQAAIYAYIVTKDQQAANASEIRTSLKTMLPDFMLPARLIQIDSIPLTVNGKLDQKALPEPEKHAYTADDIRPKNEIEKVMAEIWEELLDVEELGVSANFFELGGDSIKALQVCARLKQRGFETTVREMFEHQTLGELSARVRKAVHVIDQSPVEGEITWTPIQQWFFSQSLEIHHFNQSVMLYRTERFDETALKKVLKSLVIHHDALRIVCRYENGRPVQISRGIDLPDKKLYALELFDVKDNLTEAHNRIKEAASQMQEHMRLETGPLLHAGLFRTENGDHLFLTIHHLVVDAVSWRILFEDFSTAYKQAVSGETIKLPQKTDSYLTYSQSIADYSKSRQMQREAAYWDERENRHIQPIPKDNEAAPNTFKDTEVIDFNLSRHHTELLLTAANKAYSTEMNDIFLTALGLALQQWTGYDQFKISMEGHGRESYLEDIDISRTVGWFTSIYPVWLDMSHSDHKNKDERLGHLIKQTKDMLHRIPHKGAGYGVLKYTNKKWDSEKGSPDISFNYLGQFDQDIQSKAFEVSDIKPGNEISPNWERPHALDISGAVSSGCLNMHMIYNRLQFEKKTIQTFAGHFKQTLENIIEHCTGKENREWSASDFTDEDLTLDELSEIMGAVNKL
ncbi:amino acid adenylation domain-containing protein [Bacillus inaquosorum]|uniref:non-ribosomal peptide synthetase n=1 Tax=Bacillus inaquosorum TaxID=483913 RepID=UPI0022804686|nr:non-ribosomal peptide synthetase [Bacillus inaquosorum]MCY9011319.1 amino acid adenylation domain-containing protein [Bacillus inaquosorum]MCY9039655.1 amino acid adenylation domain-containing protein [Bacillus inaquosorum]MCY9047946.1 amino acid adenylation domain-containing protein [Bacillus inaquosorum]